MFYIIQVEIIDGMHHERGYLASGGIIVENKKGGYKYRSYSEAKQYMIQATSVYKLENLKIVLR